MTKAAIYVRVSTQEQKNDMQLTELREYCARMRWEVVEYAEKASSVKKRPILDKLLADARMRKFDVLVVWKLDRFARSMKQFTANVLALDACGVRFIAPNQGIDTDKQNPMGKFIMHIFAALAELEREMILERVRAGKAQYNADYAAGKIGKELQSRSGKNLPAHRPKRIFRRDQAIELRNQGMSYRKIAEKLGVPVTTVVESIKVYGK